MLLFIEDWKCFRQLSRSPVSAQCLMPLVYFLSIHALPVHILQSFTQVQMDESKAQVLSGHILFPAYFSLDIP